MISIIVADRITKLSKNSPRNSLETLTNESENIELGREILKEKYIYPEKRQQNVGDIRLIYGIIISKNNKNFRQQTKSTI